MLEQAGYICARCSSAGLTCCSRAQAGDADCGPEAPGQDCFPLSPAEAERIGRALELDAGLAELAAGGFAEPEPNGPDFMGMLGQVFPGEQDKLARLFPAGGQHMRMRLINGRDCVFLTGEGCSLPGDARPRYCKLYPFWPSRGGIYFFANPHCLAQREGRSLRDLYRLFGTDEAGVRAAFAALRRDWGLDRD